MTARAVAATGAGGHACAFARGRRLAATRPGLLVLLAAVPITAAVMLLAQTPSDVVWQAWIARQLNGGADLYTDVVEVNPPLWFWMAMPADALATRLGVSAHAVVKLGAGAYGLAGLALCAGLVRGRGQTTLLLAAAAGTLLLPAWHAGQREHLALIASLPYLLLAARRVGGGAVGWRLAASVGAFAAPGLALKHYYVMLPLLVEVWRVARGGRVADTVRPETITLGAGAALYAGAVLAFSPDFLTEAVPLVRLAYGGYQADWSVVLAMPVFVTVAAAAACAWRFGRLPPGPARHRAEALGIGLVAFLLAYLVQKKGMAYHLVPAAGLCVLLMTMAARGRAS